MDQKRAVDDLDAARNGARGEEPADRAGFDVGALANAVAEALGRGSDVATTSTLDVVEGAARSLARRVVAGAIDAPRPVADRRRLAKVLKDRSPSPALGGATAAALGTVARRLGPAKFLARRTPLWLAMAAGPAAYASIARGADELALVASHLVHRARAAGFEPDPERLRRVSLQVLTGREIRPDHEPSHGPLAVAWTRRAVRAALPFSSSVSTRDPDQLAAAAAAVDENHLRPRADTIVDLDGTT